MPLATFAHDRPAGMPDLPPDASSAQYQAVLSQRGNLRAADSLDVIFRVGERNLKWLEHINSKRPANDKLSFTSKETQKAYPITEANEYNPPIVRGDFDKLKAEYPSALGKVVFENAAFTDTPPIEVAAYLEWSRKLDRVYQSAARWRTMQSYLPYLSQRRKQDIRGYYFLSRLGDRSAKLKNYASLEQKERTQIREWLIGMCFNGSWASIASCERDVDRAISGKNDLNSLYSSYVGKSSSLYNSYFEIPSYAARSDFRWENLGGGKTRLVAPFTDPEKEDVRQFMQVNVEDEWRFKDWDLKLPFTTANGAPYVVFEPGVTPNVNGLGGDRITMNANQPLTEYDAQWTIRHEFGHVLGLPDCYVEFYVPEREVIINYQIDIDNIMCSRRGHVKQENVDELRKAYAN